MGVFTLPDNLIDREAWLAVRGTPLQPNPDGEETRSKTKMMPGVARDEVVGDPVTTQDIKAFTIVFLASIRTFLG